MLNISPFSRGDPRTPQLQRHVGGAPVTVWLNNPQHDWLAPKMKWWKTAFNHGFIMDSETDSVLETEELKLQNSCFEVVSWPLPYRGYGDLTPRNSTSTNITCHKFSAWSARITQKTVHHTMSFIWPTIWRLWNKIIPNRGIPWYIPNNAPTLGMVYMSKRYVVALIPVVSVSMTGLLGGQVAWPWRVMEVSAEWPVPDVIHHVFWSSISWGTTPEP
jgi:hypothetical protein